MGRTGTAPDFGRAAERHGIMDMEAEYLALEELMRKEAPDLQAIVYKTGPLLQQDTNHERARGAFRKVIGLLLEKGDRATIWHLSYFRHFIQPGTELERMRMDALTEFKTGKPVVRKPAEFSAPVISTEFFSSGFLSMNP